MSIAAPGRAAYVSLLGTTTLGTLASTLMSAPINDIGADLGAAPSQMVLAVSAFTVAMVAVAPVAGWACTRIGATRFLVLSLVLMVLAQVAAASATGLAGLVAARAVQGVACSGIPPAIHQGLLHFWPEMRRRSMAAWASAIGVGQAVGPPAGGLVSDAVGWRGLFLVYALVCAAGLLCLLRFVPAVPAVQQPVEVGGTAQLVAGAGLLVVGMTWAGQGGAPGPSAALVGAGLALLGWALRPRRPRGHLLGRGVLRDPAYLVSTAAAAAGMAAMGITLVSVPLYLGRDVGLTAGAIGAVTAAVAVGMVLFAPVAARVARRVGAGTTLAGGLVALVVVPLAVATLEGVATGPGVVLPLAALLLLLGCAIATVQSMAAVVLLGSVGASSGLATGVHNTGRFTGLATGYAWVAVVYSAGSPALVHTGTAVAAAATLVLAAAARARLPQSVTSGGVGRASSESAST
ncbi:MFS transporter [Janibacter melonis]|uniref:MFS transporter n=1 Tax=Janibacter melonis TaxID=262209 RepID=UPI001918C4BA|nr:MFS transporter [Janibacter melonis]